MIRHEGGRSDEVTKCVRRSKVHDKDRKGDRARVVLPVRMPPEAIANVRIRTFDGAGWWKYID